MATQIRYAPLFNLDFRHDYFPASECPVVRVFPANETSGTMQQLGIRLVERAYGVECFYNDGAPPAGQLLQTEAPVRLTFLLRTDDPLFLNYTQLPGSPLANSIQYFTNLHSTGASVHLPATVETTLPARPAVFTVKTSNPAEHISLRDELGNVLYTWSSEQAGDQWAIQAVNEEATEFLLNLSLEAPGRYSLFNGEAVLLDFVLLPRNWREGDLGILTVYVGKTTSGETYLLDKGVVTPADYTIAFAARPTVWRYYLIDTSQPGYEAFELVDNDSGQVVAAAGPTPTLKVLPDGSAAVVLSAPSPLPLHQRPGARFTLRMKRKGHDQDTPITLPLPSAEAKRISLQEDALGSPTFYSDLYVYL